MNNTVVKSFLDQHIESFELHMNETKSFEHFINYLSARNYLSRHFDPSDLSLGKGEVGIDGVAIIVDDTLITKFDQIKEYFLDNKNGISVSFVFTQAKTSENLKLEAIYHFLSCTKDFIIDKQIPLNSKGKELQKICNFILEHPTQLSKNPDLHMYYGYTGQGEISELINTAIETEKKELQKSAYFDEISFSFLDANRIISICRSIKNRVQKQFNMIDCAVLPSISNVNEAYVGIALCSDFIKLITNEENAIISTLFEDNVRFFQGHNTINAEIQNTLSDKDTQCEFSVLNNGVTIVAKEIRRTGNLFTLTDFQIVNGCQTSFVLYENRNQINKDAALIIKLISTSDKRITDSIVKTTNRQTPIQNEAFETLRDFHKNLENAYEFYTQPDRLYYERRSKQYESTEICKSRIVSFPFQTASYIAVFLGEPQSTHRYYGDLLKSYKSRMYNDDDVLDQYCLASLIVYLVDRFLKKDDSNIKYREYRFHIAYMLRCMAVKQPVPKANSKNMKGYCNNLYEKIKDESWVKTSILKVIDAISHIIDNEELVAKEGNAPSRMKDFTKLLVEKLKVNSQVIKPLPELKKGQKVKCKILNWNKSFVYVEITDYRENGSIHIKQINGNFISDIGDVVKQDQEIEAYLLNDKPDEVFGYSLSMIK